MKHININILIQLVDETIDAQLKPRVLQHIQACPMCEKRLNIIKSMGLSPNEKPSKSPSDRVKDNVLAFYDDLAAKENDTYSIIRKFQEFLALHKRAVAFTLSTVAVVLITFTVLFQGPFKPGKNFLLSIQDLKGSVFLNTHKISILDKISQKSEIKTDDKASLVITYETLMRIEIQENSVLTFTSLSKNSPKHAYTLTCLVSNGQLTAQFPHKGKVFYTFNTPHAAITSGGTEFTLSVAKEKTDLFVKTGQLLIQAKNTIHKSEAKAGNIYTIDAKGKINSIMLEIKNTTGVKKPQNQKTNVKNTGEEKHKYRRQWP